MTFDDKVGRMMRRASVSVRLHEDSVDIEAFEKMEQNERLIKAFEMGLLFSSKNFSMASIYGQNSLSEDPYLLADPVNETEDKEDLLESS